MLVDIYYDHLLAKDFNTHSEVPLEPFTQQVYDVYVKHKDILPFNSERFLGYFLENDIYNAYSKEEGIEKVLFHLSHRIKHGTMLNESIVHFRNNRNEFNDYFSKFIEELKREFIK